MKTGCGEAPGAGLPAAPAQRREGPGPGWRGGSTALLNASRSSECWQGAGSASECSPAEPMSWDRMRYILWDNNCSVPPQIHMTPFTAAFAERSPYVLRKEKEREGESERAEKRRAPTAQISNLPPPPPPPPNTQQQPPPQIRCAPKTPPPPDCKPQNCLQHTHARRGSEKARERGEELAASSFSAGRLHCTSCFFGRAQWKKALGFYFSSTLFCFLWLFPAF